MKEKILVSYASTHGATQEVAGVIGETLREGGFQVDIQAARDVRTLEDYRAVVLGAPLYMFHWHKDALRFLSRFQKALSAGLPLAIFGGGPFGKGDEEEWAEVRKQLSRELEKFTWLAPVSVEVIGGKFDPARLRFPWNLIPALKGIPANDLRDWDAIRTWAASLAEQFEPALSPA